MNNSIDDSVVLQRRPRLDHSREVTNRPNTLLSECDLTVASGCGSYSKVLETCRNIVSPHRPNRVPKHSHRFISDYGHESANRRQTSHLRSFWKFTATLFRDEDSSSYQDENSPFMHHRIHHRTDQRQCQIDAMIDQRSRISSHQVHIEKRPPRPSIPVYRNLVPVDSIDAAD